MVLQRSSGFIEPCLPSKVARPPSGPLWVHEIKHDGYRLMVRRDDPRVRCFTRYLKGRAGDAANVVLSAVGHNFRRILAWLQDFWRLILTALIAASSVQSALRSAS